MTVAIVLPMTRKTEWIARSLRRECSSGLQTDPNPKTVGRRNLLKQHWSLSTDLRNTTNSNPLQTILPREFTQGYPYGKLPHLRRVSIKKNTSSRRPFKVIQKPVACSTPQGSYSADMDQYLADRFPRAFTAFLKEGARRRSSLPIDLYVHNHPVAEAYEFHQRDGYTTFYFLQTRRGQLHRDIYLAVKSQPRAYRVVLTSVRGNDRQANVLCQIQRTHVFSNYRFVESQASAAPVCLQFAGDLFKTGSERMWLLFGFKGNWARMLLAQNWRQSPLVKEGLDIDLFTHPDDQAEDSRRSQCLRR